MRRRWTPVALVCAAALACAATIAGPAAAAGNAVINDCQANGRLTQSYPLTELRQALAVMSPSTKEYSNCQDVLNQAILTAVGEHRSTGGPGSSSGGSFLPTPVIVILVVLVLAAVTFGALAVRRRGQGGPGGPGGPAGGRGGLSGGPGAGAGEGPTT